MTTKEIENWKNSDEFYEMFKMSWDSLSKLEEDNSEKVYIVDNARMDLMKQCNTLRDECREEDENGNDAKILNYMSAQDNAMDSESIEMESAEYYSMVLKSYESLSIDD